MFITFENLYGFTYGEFYIQNIRDFLYDGYMR